MFQAPSGLLKLPPHGKVVHDSCIPASPALSAGSSCSPVLQRVKENNAVLPACAVLLVSSLGTLMELPFSVPHVWYGTLS